MTAAAGNSGTSPLVRKKNLFLSVSVHGEKGVDFFNGVDYASVLLKW
jgi:hypothetical protein